MAHVSSSILVRTSSGSQLEMPVRADVAEALYQRLQQAIELWGSTRAGELSAHALLGVSVVVTEPDLRPPTSAQIKFALDIVRRLGVELPDGVLQDRSRMGAFLTEFSDRLPGRR